MNPAVDRTRLPRVAVVGSGVAGLGAAHALVAHAHVTLFEASDHFGGHAQTVDVTLDGHTQGVDTGFLVFNHRTYPRLRALFDELGVRTVPAGMSFSVQSGGLEWSGAGLSEVFAQRRNLLRPSFWRMLAELMRFNRRATELAERGEDGSLRQTVGEFLDAEGFGKAFREGYFLPMVACIWSCPTEQMLRFPVGTMIRFCHNHGLLQVRDQPPWYTVCGGSREYVRRVVAGVDDARLRCPVSQVRRQVDGSVELATPRGPERFDAVVLASHAPQSLALLERTSAQERQVLGAFRTHHNRGVLHTDTRMLPSRERAWAAWNYERGNAGDEQAAVCLHYLINRLQPLPWKRPVIVSLNPLREPDPKQVIGEYRYAHPVFDEAAIAAQRRLPQLQGEAGVWFCGAWMRYGFHEDGLMAGQLAAQGVIEQLKARAPGALREAA